MEGAVGEILILGGKLGDPAIHILMILILEFCPWAFWLLDWMSDAASPTRETLNCKNSAALSVGFHPDKCGPRRGKFNFLLCSTISNSHSSKRYFRSRPWPSFCQEKREWKQTGSLYVISCSPHLSCGRLFPKEPETKADYSSCQEQEDNIHGASWGPRVLIYKEAQGWQLGWNEYPETYHDTAFASFAFYNDAFSHILHRWHLWCSFGLWKVCWGG